MSRFGDDFGQKVDLTASIRNILRNYPEGTAILKELVQNADDAGARKVSFCLDLREHGTSKLASNSLAQFQGLSLLVYNDAVFTERDFQSIQRIGDSLKKTGTTTKIGRFGIGFNAVYHWTDLPSFISASNVVFLDPQARFLPNVNPSNPGKNINYLKDKNIVNEMRDQFCPYEAYDMDFNQTYKGTLFRLPLRTEEQASTSTLSKRYLNENDAINILKSLEVEASAMLLFLRNVECIEIQKWEKGATSPKLQFRAEISNVTSDLRKSRDFMSSKQGQGGTIIKPTDQSERRSSLSKFLGFSSDSNVEQYDNVDYELHIKCDTINQRYHEYWEICNQYGGPGPNEIAFNPANELLRLVPWGGVASLVNRQSAEQSELNHNGVTSGLAYCFLPLPVQTGLPIMVNAFFELSSNRRDVWQAGVDMTGDGRTRAEWNVSLMRDILGPCYVRLLERLREAMGYCEAFQNIWPGLTVGAPWNNVVNSVLSRCKDKSLLAPVDRLAAAANSAKAIKITDLWIPCNTAVILPSSSHVASDEGKQLLEFLAAAKVGVVECTDGLRKTLEEGGVCTSIATPSFLRKLIKQLSISTSSSSQQDLLRIWCSFLLKYSMKDLEPESTLLSELHGLRILPLRDSSVGTLCVYNDSMRSSIDMVVSMGFSTTDAINALNHCKFNVEDAVSLLGDTNSDSINSRNFNHNNNIRVFILGGDDIAETFEQSSGILINEPLLGPHELHILRHKIMKARSNVRRFEANLVPELLKEALPIECLNGVVAIDSLVPHIQERLNKFIKAFWHFAFTHSDVIPAIAGGVSVLPSRKRDLYPLSRMSVFIVGNTTSEAKGLPEAIVNLLESIGVNITDASLLKDPTQTIPVQFWDYVSNASRDGIITCLDSLLRDDRNQLISRIEDLDSKQKDALVGFVAAIESVDSLKPKQCEVLKQLPIFKLASDGSYVNLVGLSGSKKFTLNISTGIPNEVLSNDFIACGTNYELELFPKLGVKVLQRCEYFRYHFLPKASSLFNRCPGAALETVMSLLSELKSLRIQDRGFIEFLQEQRFVPPSDQADGEPGARNLRKPSELYDFTIPEIKVLMEDSLFPSPSLRRDDILLSLRTLGLKQVLDWKSLADCASVLSNKIEHEESYKAANEVSKETVDRGYSLLQYLDKNVNSLLGFNEAGKERRKSTFMQIASMFGNKDENVEETNIEYIKTIVNSRWLPTKIQSDNPCMPWPEEQELLAAPYNSRPLQDAWFCSSTISICRDQVESSHLKRLFGWDEAVPTKAVAAQLREIAFRFIRLVKQQKLTEGNEGSQDNNDVISVQTLRENISALVPQLYQRLNRSITDPNDAVSIMNELRGQAFIWVGDMFVRPSKVAYNSAVNAMPYLHSVPQDLAVYRSLLDAFEVRNEFQFRDYLSVIDEVAHRHGTIEPLPENLLDLIISIITLVGSDSSQSGVKGQNTRFSGDVYMPNVNGVLKLASELVYDDVPWLAGPQYADSRRNLNLVHKSISGSVATQFGIKSLRMIYISRNLDDKLFASNNVQNSNMESFGQAESLTSRLRTILDMYPDGNPIFSELIQNADDAGATTVRIMLDETQYGTESLLGPSLAPLQGASLLVFNDAIFSENDFRSLASIGRGAKLEKLATTGRFGLGFNSVYHVTDTPTFISGDYMVLLDPHTTYVPGSSSVQPGLRVKFTGSDMHKTFPDQFTPFSFFGCDFDTNFNGTLFRFPLRSDTLARSSEISKRAYNTSTVTGLLEQLRPQLANHLLFLRSVRSIEVYHCTGSINKDTGKRIEPQLLFKATASTQQHTQRGNQTLMSYFDKKVQTKQAMTRDAFYKELSRTNDGDLPVSTYSVTLSTENHIDVNREENYSITSDDYLVVAGLQGGEAKSMACSKGVGHLKLIPLGAVAACYGRRGRKGNHEDKSTTVDVDSALLPPVKGVAFCFLPLPVFTQLPLHINGYFELSSNRRDIWRGDDTTGESKLRSNWNIYMLRDVVAPLYSELLTAIMQRLPDDENSSKAVSALLPSPVPQEPWDGISEALYSLIRDKNILWSPLHGGGRVVTKNAYLLEDSDASSSPASLSPSAATEDEEELKLMQLLLEEEIPVVCVASHLKQTMVAKYAGTVAGAVSPPEMRKHFASSRNHPSITITTTSSSNNSNNKDEQMKSRNRVINNVIFWLKYCIQDIPRNHPYETLHGLRLVPLQDSRIGVFGSPNDAPIYLCGDMERKLVGHVADVVVSDEELGSLSVFLRQPVFHNSSNVRQMTCDDFFSILEGSVPTNWKNAQYPINREGRVEDSWLVNLWTYITGKDCLSLFLDKLPILPIVAPQSYGDGSYLVSPSTDRLVLHMAFRQLPIEAADALSALGIYIFDETVLANLSFSSALSKIYCTNTPRGFLDVLTKAVTRLSRTESNKDKRNINFNWSTEARDALRNYILDNVVARMSGWTPDDAPCLLSLPIWSTYGESNPNIRKALYNSPVSIPSLNDTPYMDVEEESLMFSIPPEGVMDSVLGKTFVKLRSDADRSLYKKLGLKQPSLGEVANTCILPLLREGRLKDELNVVSVFLLKKLVEFERESPGISGLLQEMPFILDSDNVPCLPRDLYDPEVAQLVALLPSQLFPNSDIYGDKACLARLRSLGMQSTIDSESVTQAASSISDDFCAQLRVIDEKHRLKKNNINGSNMTDNSNSLAEMMNNDSIIEDAKKRGAALLQYVDTNIERLLNSVDADGLERFHSLEKQKRDRSRKPEADDNSSDTVDVALIKTPLGGKWANTLRRLCWLPVHTIAPSDLDRHLPWETRLHRTCLASPIQSRPVKDAWLCSSSQRIVSQNITSPELRHMFGWNSHISGRCVAKQLDCMIQVFQNAQNARANESNQRSSLSSGTVQVPVDLIQTYSSVLPRIYGALAQAVDEEAPDATHMWQQALKGTATIWVTDQFVTPSRVAFERLHRIDAEPFLFPVKGFLVSYKGLLKELGVRDSFDAQDLINIIKELRDQYDNRPLPAHQLDMVLGLLRLIVRLKRGDNDGEEGDEEKESKESSNNDENSEVNTEDLSEQGVVPGMVSVTDRHTGGHGGGAAAIEIDLRGICIPDRAGSLFPAEHLSFDDAPWISQQLDKRSTSTRYVHDRISNIEAQILGARSLREQLFAGDEIVCPGAKATGEQVRSETLLEGLLDLQSLADVLGAKGLDIIYDERTHPKESLMHPGLVDTQGPAMVVRMQGCQLSSEEIVQVLTNPELLPTIRAMVKPEWKGFPLVGRRLTAAFCITDCLQVLSGSNYYIFDPCGKYLFSSTVEGVKFQRAKAQRCTVNTDVLTRFPDQFESLFALPLNLRDLCQAARANVNDVIVRMPLRTEASVISDHIITVEEVKSALLNFKKCASGAMLFSRNINRICCMRYLQPQSQLSPSTSAVLLSTTSIPIMDFEISLSSHPNERMKRYSCLDDKSWKSSQLMSFFKNFTPPEEEYILKLQTKENTSERSLLRNWLSKDEDKSGSDQRPTGFAFAEIGPAKEELWLVIATNAAGVTRDIALQEVYRDLKLKPLTAVAARVSEEDQVATSKDAAIVGLAYCGAGVVAETGLPFHIESHFIQSKKFGYREFALSKKVNSRFQWSDSGGQKDRANFGSLPHNKVEKWNTALFRTSLEVMVPKLLNRCASILYGGTEGRMKNKEGIYRYWPFIDALAHSLTVVLKDSSFYVNVADCRLFLGINGFNSLDQVKLAKEGLNEEVTSYLREEMNLAYVPPLVTHDLAIVQKKGHGLRLQVLEQPQLRALLKANAPRHCVALSGKSNVVLSLLDFCLSDLESLRQSNTREFELRRAYRDLARCPLLLMADNTVRSFPNNDSDAVTLFNDTVETLVPSLAAHMISGKLTDRCQIFDDHLFKHALDIRQLSASFLKNHMQLIIPQAWKRCFAIVWTQVPPGLAHKMARVNLDERKSRKYQCPAIAPNTNYNTAADSENVNEGINSTGSNSNSNYKSANESFSSLILYTLWNDVFMNESSAEMSALAEYPIVPAVSAGRRVLLQPRVLQYALCAFPTQKQNDDRDHCRREIQRLLSLNRQTRSDQSQTGGIDGGSMSANSVDYDTKTEAPWAWVKNQERILPIREVVAAVVATEGTPNTTTNETNSAPTALPLANVQSEEDPNHTLPDEQRVSSIVADSDDEIRQTAVALETASGTGSFNEPAAATIETTSTAETAPAPVSAPTITTDQYMLEVYHKLGVPIIDGGLFEAPPPMMKSGLSPGRRLLQCLYMATVDDVMVHRCSGQPTPPNQPPNYMPDTDMGSLILFDNLNVDERAYVLQQIYAAHSHPIENESPFNNTELNMIKQLPLFTSYKGSATALTARPTNGNYAYWIEDESTLDLLGGVLDFQGGNTQQAPVLLRKDPKLVDLYRLLDIEQLTESLAIKNFVLPSLKYMDAEQKFDMLRRLAGRWSVHKEDRELVAALKDTKFVPAWRRTSNVMASTPASASANASATPPLPPASGFVQSAGLEGVLFGGEVNTTYEFEGWELDSVHPARLPRDVMSWQNDLLLRTLSGTQEPKYFPPPMMRTDEWHEMLLQLGMKSNLENDLLLSAAEDVSSLSNTDLEQAREKGRMLLLYIKDDDVCTGITLPTAKRLGKIRFVPVQKPVGVEPGGFVLFRPDLVSFDECLTSHAAGLGFTVTPILDEAVALPTILNSSLGVSTSPSLSKVLKHLKNLTEFGQGGHDMLDRWNFSLCSINKTFCVIFDFLGENWADIPRGVQSALRTSPVVPAGAGGQQLIRPSRLYFRLTQDLSPFMHEVPRVYGSQERFLKLIGVKETPTADDYIAFLKEFAQETRGVSLNPNESLAAVAIISNIAETLREDYENYDSQLKRDSIMKRKLTNHVFIPDENSRLMLSDKCLLNDDDWLCSRVSQDLKKMGMSIVHPDIQKTDVDTLQIPSLSSVLAETLLPGSSPKRVEEAITTELQQMLQHEHVIGPVTELIVSFCNDNHFNSNAKTGDSSSNSINSIASSGISIYTSTSTSLELHVRELLTSSRPIIVHELQTQLTLKDPRRHRKEHFSLQLGDSIVFCDTSSINAGLDEELNIISNNTNTTNSSNNKISRGRESTIYINSSLIGDPITYEMAYSLGICKVVGVPEALGPSIALIFSANQSHRQRILMSLRTGGGGRDDGTVVKKRGLPGEELIVADADLLELAPQRNFRLGEVVAYRCRIDGSIVGSAQDSKVRISSVTSSTSSKGKNNETNLLEGEDNADANSDVGVTTRYGVVAAVGEIGAGALRWIGIRVSRGSSSGTTAAGGNGVVRIMSSSVYSFKSARQLASQKLFASPERNISSPVNSDKQKQNDANSPPPPPGASTPMTPSLASSTESVASVSAILPPPPPDPVNREQLLSAVSSMLHRANVPFSSDTKDLMKRVLELDEENLALKGQVEREQTRAVEAIEDLQSVNAANKCPICVDNAVTHVITPCGHAICDNCLEMLPRNRCPFCRSTINKSIKILL